MIKVLVLGKGRKSQIPVDLVKATEQRPDKLHTSNGTKKLGYAIHASWVLGVQSNAVVRRLELDVLGRDEVVHFAEQLGTLGGQRSGFLKLVEENDLLVGSEGLNV